MKPKEKRTSNTAELYLHESQWVEKADAVMKDTTLSMEQLREAYCNLGHEFQRLLKKTIKITRIGDAHQRKLLSANEQIEMQREELKVAYEKLDLIARTDPLTGLSNRRDFLERFEHEAHRYNRNRDSFTVVLGDIDHFKFFNDTYGHDCGDFVLVEISKTMRSMIRKIDTLGRWGGEEFIMLLPHSPIKGGLKVAEGIRTKVAETVFEYNQLKLSVSMTFGVCEFDGSTDIDTCIKRADDALYYGKENGRNRVVTWLESIADTVGK